MYLASQFEKSKRQNYVKSRRAQVFNMNRTLYDVIVTNEKAACKCDCAISCNLDAVFLIKKLR